MRQNDGERQFAAASGKYPTAGRGRLNYYKLFVEMNWDGLASVGHLGMVIPSGLTTNTYERPLWHRFIETAGVRAVFDFENRRRISPAIDGRTKFSLFVASRRPTHKMRVGCWLLDVAELAEAHRIVELTPNELDLFRTYPRTCFGPSPLEAGSRETREKLRFSKYI